METPLATLSAMKTAKGGERTIAITGSCGPLTGFLGVADQRNIATGQPMSESSSTIRIRVPPKAPPTPAATARPTSPAWLRPNTMDFLGPMMWMPITRLRSLQWISIMGNSRPFFNSFLVRHEKQSSANAVYEYTSKTSTNFQASTDEFDPRHRLKPPYKDAMAQTVSAASSSSMRIVSSKLTSRNNYARPIASMLPACLATLHASC